MAERPMAVDDAGTLDRGGAKLDFGWSKDDQVRGLDAAAGYGPIDNVELELAFEMARDLSAAAGHGNSRSFANAGVAWEF
mgnify:CR=1 FL=1